MIARSLRTRNGPARRALRASLVLIAGVVLATTALGQEPPRAAAWISDRALVYAEIPDPAAVLDRLESREVQTVMADVPGLGEALKRPELNQARAAVGLLSLSLATTPPKAARALSGGGIVLAVEGEPSAPRIALFVTPRDRALLDRANVRIVGLAGGDARKPGKAGSTEVGEHRGIATYQLGGDEAHAIVDDVLIVTNSKAFLDELIDRARGVSAIDPIRASAPFVAGRAACGAGASAWALARLDRLREADPEKYRAATPDVGATILFGAWYEAFRQSPWAAVALTWTGDRIAADLALPTPEGGFPATLRRFQPGAGQGASRPIDPPGTILSASLWRDLAALWEVREEVLPPEALQNLAQLDSFAGQFFGGRDFGSGVLGALRADWRFVIANRTGPPEGPVPDVQFPGFALLIPTDAEDTDFQVRLRAAFQSFVGLANLGAAQQKAPPLILGSEQADGVTLLTTAFVPDREADAEAGAAAEPVDVRYNFTPSAAQVGSTFVLSSNVDLARSLIRTLQAAPAPGPPTGSTLLAEASGPALAELLLLNRQTLATRNMLQKGADRAAADAQVEAIGRIIRYLNHGRLSAEDRDDGVRFHLEFQTKPPEPPAAAPVTGAADGR